MEPKSTIRSNQSKQLRLRIAPNDARVTIAVAAGAFGIWLLQFESLHVSGILIVVAFFLIGIGSQQSWAFYLAFATLIFCKFAFAPFRAMQLTQVVGYDLLFASVAIVFAALCFRYLELSKYIRAFYPEAERTRDTEENQPYQFPSLIGGRWWLIPVAVVFAASLLWLIPLDYRATRRYWITPNGARLIFLTFVLFFGWFVCRSVLALVMRWRIEPRQAEIQSRCLIADELWSDQVPLEKRRVKYRIRNRRS